MFTFLKKSKDDRKFWCADLSGNTGDEWYLNVPIDDNGTPLYFLSGKRFPKSTVFHASIYKTGALVDVTFTLDANILVNDKVLNLLDGLCPDDFEAYQVVVKNCPIPYHALNCKHVVDCLDAKRSNAKRWKKGEIGESKVGDYKSAYPLTIDTSRVPQGIHMFRIKNYAISWIVSESIRERFVNAGVTGVTFTSVV